MAQKHTRIVLMLAVILLCSVQAFAQDAPDIMHYQEIVELEQSNSKHRIDIRANFTQSEHVLSLVLPKNAENIAVRFDEVDYDCLVEEGTRSTRLNCLFVGQRDVHNVTIRFSTHTPFVQFENGVEFGSTYVSPGKTEDLRILVKLPEGFIIPDGARVSPEPWIIYSDGQRIILLWKQQDVEGEYTFSVAARRVGLNSARVSGVFGLLFVMLLVGAYVYYRRHRQVQNLEGQLRIDGLTQVCNRASFDTDIAKAAASERDFALIMVDIDHFKKINDTQGHQKGDEVLKEVAKILSTKTRGTTYRYGGEEFALLLDVAHVPHIRKITRRIRNSIARRLGETVSMGVAIRQENEGAGALIKRADLALYRAKENGRNRTYIHHFGKLSDIRRVGLKIRQD